MNIDGFTGNISRGFYQLVNYFFAADVPWHFRLLLIMVIIFFAGGLYLDSMASRITLALPKLEAEQVIDANSPGNSNITSQHIDALKEHTKNKLDNISSSAKLLYDFSKIALGALLASLSSTIKTNITPNEEKEIQQKITSNRDK